MNQQINENGSHIGDNILVQQILAKDRREVKELEKGKDYELNKSQNIFVRLLSSILVGGADFLLVYIAAINDWLSEIVSLVNSCFEDKINVREVMLLSLIAVLFILVVDFSIFIWGRVGNLLLCGRSGPFRRIGCSVIRINPKVCPICGAKMSAIYDKGNYIRCNREQVEHRWPIDLKID